MRTSVSNVFSGSCVRFLSSGAIAIASLPLAHAATITYQQGVSPSSGYQSSDTMIRGDGANASNNYGTGSYNIAGTVPAGSLRALFGFTLADIPSDAIITSVTLTIVGERNDSTSPNSNVAFNLHQLNGTFAEGTGGLGGATNSGATWINKSNGVAWTTPGGDFDSTVLSSISLNPRNVDEATYTFNSTAELVAAAQNALANGGDLSLLMKMNNTSEALAVRNVFFFYGDDAVGTDNADVSKRPILTVTYIPEPSAVISAALGGLFLLGRRRRK